MDIYTSQAEAQGFVTIRYHRPDGDYGDYTSANFEDFWGLHLWTSLGGLTGWTEPKRADGIDDYGAYFVINAADYPDVLDFSLPLNFIVHRGNEKDPPDSPDRSFEPSQQRDHLAAIGRRGGLQPARRGRGLCHRCTTAGRQATTATTPAPTTNDFWGMHTWGGAADPGWTTPRKPVDQDNFGVIFEVPLFENAAAAQLHPAPRR